MPKEKYVQVLLPLPIPQEFTYLIPDHLQGQFETGSRLLVQFGPRKIQTAVAWKLLDEDPGHEVKPILGVLDAEAIINPLQIKLIDWMSDYYLCTKGEVLNAALPTGLKLESHTRLLANENFQSENPLPEQESLVWFYLLKNPGITIRDLGKVLKKENPLPLIHQLNTRGAIFLEEKLTDKYSPKTELHYALHPDYQKENQLGQLLDNLNKAPKQKRALERFLDISFSIENSNQSPFPRKILLQDPEISQTALEALAKKKILLTQKIEVTRLDQETSALSPPNNLSPEQHGVFMDIHNAPPGSIHLLHGVTSSGKTEIYTHLIKETLDQGMQVLYLLPEIALTEQIIRRLRGVFGNTVGVFHSKYTDSERIELWKDLLSEENQHKLILGARSAVFLPFSKLGLIIIDEEHETSYKQQDPAPRYHARDTAIVLSRIHSAKVVLGTATPSIESYYNAIRGKYILHELKTRYSQIQLPEIVLANLKDAHRKKRMQGHLTPELVDAIDQALANGEQIILFQNRRGYSPYIECDACGHIPKCRDCDVSLTLHKYKNRIVCHYCGYSEPVSSSCPLCAANSMRTKGLGTEGLEDEISILFPHAGIARLDLETTRSRKAYTKIIADFEVRKTNILIGTQMVTKGLDFSGVRVVGIINADNLLHFPDFRSYERSFQLMTQVSGRAGRREDQGLVIIQTWDPTQRIIRQVMHNDYQGMFRTELDERKDFSYPPFTRLIRINIKHKDQELLNRCAYVVAKELRIKWRSGVLGPQAPVVSRVQSLHIRQILIKSERGKAHHELRNDIRSLMSKLKADKTFRSVIVQPDVDPV